MQSKIVVHTNPVWRDRSDFIIAGRIDSDNTQLSMEQLWARQLDDFTFEICCIPFFLYDLALGDVVRTSSSGDDKYVVDSVVRKSGRFVFRVWFSSVTDTSELESYLTQLGALCERRSPSSQLLAIDAGNDKVAHAVANALQKREEQGELTYETGQ